MYFLHSIFQNFIQYIGSEIIKAVQQNILEKGDTENPMKLVRAFLRREPNSKAFLKKQGIVE